MSPHRKCIFIIDDAHKNNALADYFSNFNYYLIQRANLDDISLYEEELAALLINSTFMKTSTINLADLYKRFKTPLIVINDIYDEKLCVKLLEEGADDFLVKPINPRELHARLGAISRRVQRAFQESEHEKEVLQFADWRLFPASRQLFDKDGKELLLSAGEYDLLLAFVRQPHRVLGREFLLQLTKHSDLTPFDRRIDVQISRLRQKIETDTKKPALIKTIRNGGYLFTAHVTSSKEP